MLQWESGWDRSVVLPPVPSALSSSMEKLSLTVRDLGVIIDPAISFADHVARWQGLAFFRFDSFGRFEDHWPWSPATPLFTQWSYHDWTIATWRGPEEPTRPVFRFHEGCCTTYPGAPSAESRDQRNSCEAALAWYAVMSAIQALLPRVPVSTRCCSPVSGWLLHSSQLNWGMLTASIGCRRVTSRPTHLDGDNWPRAFAVSSPAMWNSLPVDLQNPSISLPSFRKKLKTYLFNTPTWLSCLIIQIIITYS